MHGREKQKDEKVSSSGIKSQETQNSQHQLLFFGSSFSHSYSCKFLSYKSSCFDWPMLNHWELSATISLAWQMLTFGTWWKKLDKWDKGRQWEIDLENNFAAFRLAWTCNSQCTPFFWLHKLLTSVKAKLWYLYMIFIYVFMLIGALL